MDELKHVAPIPPNIHSLLLPHADMVVIHLSKYKLASLCYSDQLPTFSPKPPNAFQDLKSKATSDLLDALLGHGLPMRKLVLQFHDDIASSTASNPQSVIQPSIPNAQFPLWVATLILELDVMHPKWVKWLNALAWLEGIGVVTEGWLDMTLGLVWDLLSQLAWANSVPGLTVGHSSLAADELCCLLSETWLSDLNIDAGISLINKCSLSHTVGPCRLALPITAFVSIMATYNKCNDLGVTSKPFWVKKLSDFEKQIMDNTLDILYIPVFNNNHFMLLKVDVRAMLWMRSPIWKSDKV